MTEMTGWLTEHSCSDDIYISHFMAAISLSYDVIFMSVRIYSLWPALSGGDGEEGEQGPDHVVIVKVMSPPFPLLHLLLVFLVVDVISPMKGVVTSHHTLTAPLQTTSP